MVRDYGLYANAHRGKMRKTHEAANPFLIIEQEELFVPSKGWAEMIRKVYEVDPLFCPSCGGKMSIISFIEDYKVIDKIIAHFDGRTASSTSSRPTGTPDGSRRERRALLKLGWKGFFD